MENQNNKQDVDIGGLKTDIGWLKEELACIKQQVFNDLPHQIQDTKNRLFYGFMIGIASVIITQIILKLFV